MCGGFDVRLYNNRHYEDPYCIFCIKKDAVKEYDVVDMVWETEGEYMFHTYIYECVRCGDKTYIDKDVYSY